MNMYSLAFQFTFTLLLAVSCTLSLPAARPLFQHPEDDAAPGTPPGGYSEGPIAEASERLVIQSGDTNYDDTPSDEQKRDLFRANLGNTLFMVAMGLQLHLEAGDPLHQSLVRKECNATVATLARPPHDSSCLLTYTCKYHQDRYPNFVVQAECQNPEIPCKSCDSSVKYCSEASKRFLYLERCPSDGTCTWRWAHDDVVTSCQCM